MIADTKCMTCKLFSDWVYADLGPSFCVEITLPLQKSNSKMLVGVLGCKVFFISFVCVRMYF